MADENGTDIHNVRVNSLRAWVLAARPKTLSGAVAPVLVGAAMAMSRIMADNGGSWAGLMAAGGAGAGSWAISFALCLLFALIMQVDANFINDYFDFKKGTDREDRLGPARACAQGWVTPRAMRLAILLTTAAGCLAGLAIMCRHMQFELLAVGALCVLFCFLYTTRLSYMGWGDALVLVFFGVVPVVFTYYVITAGGWNIPLIMAGLAMGMATDNLLVVNNYRDRDQDEVSGKRTLIVRILAAQRKKFGEEKGTKEGREICVDLYLWLGVLSTLTAFTALFLFPYSTIHYPLMLVYLILHFRAFHKLKFTDGKALNGLLGTTARNIFLFGLLLAVSAFL